MAHKQIQVRIVEDDLFEISPLVQVPEVRLETRFLPHDVCVNADQAWHQQTRNTVDPIERVARFLALDLARIEFTQRHPMLYTNPFDPTIPTWDEEN